MYTYMCKYIYTYIYMLTRIMSLPEGASAWFAKSRMGIIARRAGASPDSCGHAEDRGARQRNIYVYVSSC